MKKYKVHIKIGDESFKIVYLNQEEYEQFLMFKNPDTKLRIAERGKHVI